MSDMVVCEAYPAYILHVRRVIDTPIRLSGHSDPKPRALCGRPISWDTEIPVSASSLTCRHCKAALEGIR